MKLQKIICLDFSGSELEQKYWEELDDFAESCVLITQEDIPNNNEAEILLVKLGVKINKEIIDQLPSLQYIGMLGTGYGGIDTDYASKRGITVTNIADYATQSVAEFTFGILLEYLRDIAKAKHQAKAGNYSDEFTGGEIRGKKFGIIGLGDIGMRTAKLAQAFGAEVFYWSRNRKTEAESKGIIYCELDKLIANSDIITLNLALNPDTEGLINIERINSIKNHAIFINPSPMELVNFNGLIERLRRNDIIFILDHSDEMSEEQLRILQPMDNAIVYPAIAYLSREAGELKKRIYIDNIKNYLSGTPTNKVP